MCGICGYYSRSTTVRGDVIRSMQRAISHRGPDDCGVWRDDNAGIVFGHQRLAVVDLSAAGHQPMHSSTGRFTLIFNGEIYNHKNLRADLQATLSHNSWRGHSDTETLLAAFEAWGVEITLQRLVGMFAIALWDRELRSLTLVRDRMGEKPLYFGWQGRGDAVAFLFASELKALKAHPQFIGEINRDAIALLLRYNCIPAPHSIYQGIAKLPPGHLLHLSEGDLQRRSLPDSRPYWSLLDVAATGVANPGLKDTDTAIGELDKLLRNAIGQQMVADVPLGAFLSGGVDSSTVVALMQAQSEHPVKTFTIGFNEKGFNEAVHAKAVATHLGTDHTELYVSPKQAMQVIPTLPSLYDEPFSDSSQIPTFLVSQLARQQVTVSLSGDGGDELFCGYNRYLSFNFRARARHIPHSILRVAGRLLTTLSPQQWDKISPWIPGASGYANFGDKLYKLAAALSSSRLDNPYLILVSHWLEPQRVVVNSNELTSAYTDFQSQLAGLDSTQKGMALDGVGYLPDDILVKVDRAAMGVSLESRMPFLDHRVVEYAWQLPQSLKLRKGCGKWILRQVLYRYVPKELIERPKMGFGVPLDVWLRGPLRDWAETLLNESRLRHEGFFHPDPIRRTWKEHISGVRNWHYHLWDVLMFQAWLEQERGC